MSVTGKLKHIALLADAAHTEIQDLEAQAGLVGTLRTLCDSADLRRLAQLVWHEGGEVAGASDLDSAKRRGWAGDDGGITRQGRAAARVLLERLATELDLLS